MRRSLHTLHSSEVQSICPMSSASNRIKYTLRPPQQMSLVFMHSLIVRVSWQKKILLCPSDTPNNNRDIPGGKGGHLGKIFPLSQNHLAENEIALYIYTPRLRISQTTHTHIHFLYKNLILSAGGLEYFSDLAASDGLC